MRPIAFALSLYLASSAHAGAPRQAIAPVAGTGIDVSRYSGAVDWKVVRAQGHVYGFVKATEGQTLKDPDFETHWPAMKQAGILRGAYHFYVTRDDPAAQAAFFISTASLEPGDLAPVLDVETLSAGAPPGNLLQGIQTWLDLIEAQYGAKPILYTSPGFANANLRGRFGAYPLWIAEYGVAQPRAAQGWPAWHLWQFRENAPVPGVQKSADLNRANPAGVDLSALLIPARKQ